MTEYVWCVMSSLHHAWIVQLDSLIKEAENFRRDNVMEYKGKELKAFDTGLHMMALLMKAMIEDLQKETDL
mgnify:CR=1 FL=1